MLYFSFLQGVLAFFAPCAVALLPWYITHFLANRSWWTRRSAIIQWLKLAWWAILWIVLIYAIAWVGIVVAAEFLKSSMKWIVIWMGIILIVLWILQLFGKQFSFSMHINHKHKHPIMESFLFGISYAIGALWCLFPLFLVVVTQALAAPSSLTWASYIVAYFLWISLMMLIVIVGTMRSRNIIHKYLRKILPYMNTITWIVLILAGAYIIRYQMVLI